MPKGNRFNDLCKELRDNILDSLNITDLSLFASASPIFHVNVDEYLYRRRLITFARYMNDVKRFIGLLQSSSSVVSGSSALNIIQARQGAVEINDLDVYTTLPNFEELVHFFKHSEGYKIMGNFHRPPPGRYNNTGIAKLLRLQKDERKVDIIVTNLASAVAPIFQFHNTAIMNFISAEAIFCAYPVWTLNMAGLIHPRMYKQNATNLATISGLAKYMKRGFNLCSDINELSPHVSRCIKTYNCPHTIRSTNDKGKIAWVFGNAGPHHSSSHSAAYIETGAVIWCLGGDQCENEEAAGAPSFVFAT
ncbi:hypothetical protein EV424DRAFT_1546566 [Suillus variegatus]|nr:hypothetical protein EV424DRAFT_1546566 [Suillus variegatus]